MAFGIPEPQKEVVKETIQGFKGEAELLGAIEFPDEKSTELTCVS